METPKYTYIVALRGGYEESFDNYYDALEYALSISTTNFIMDYLNDYLGEGVFTRKMVIALLETKEIENLYRSCLDYLELRFYTDKFKLIAKGMWYLGNGWTLRKKVQYE